VKIFLVLIFLTISMSSASASCLDDVAVFAEKICGQIQKTGTSHLIEANGSLKAEISGIVRKVVGGGTGGISGKITSETYENVLRTDLAKELFDVRSCRIKMVDVGRAELCKTKPVSREGQSSSLLRSAFDSDDAMRKAGCDEAEKDALRKLDDDCRPGYASILKMLTCSSSSGSPRNYFMRVDAECRTQ
jgi:hypothetical protein